MRNLCEVLVNNIAQKLINEKIIDSNKIDAYQFGIEVTLLKALHFTSYFAIALLMQKAIAFIIIFTVYYIFRGSVGGFHANTRMGCYIFSCIVIMVSLMGVDFEIELWIMYILVLSELVLLVLIAPVQNQNRRLDSKEVKYFIHKLYKIIIIFLFVFIGTAILKFEDILWLYTIGLSLTTFLGLLGKIKFIYQGN